MECNFFRRRALACVTKAALFSTLSLSQHAWASGWPQSNSNVPIDVNIVAHEDDDILFMNPDILNSVIAGHRQVTVYLTSGNYRPDDYFFARARENGAMDGYAKLLQIADAIKSNKLPSSANKLANSCANFSSPLSDNPGMVHWNVMPLQFGNFTATVAATEGPNNEGASQDPYFMHPEVTLVFLRIDSSRDTGGSPVEFDLQNKDYGTKYGNLSELWRGAINTVYTSDGSATYTNAQLTDAIAAILAYESPSVVRTQDSLNPYVVDGPTAKQVVLSPGGPFPYDHSDHYYGALFARQGLSEYLANNNGAKPAYWIYTGYSIDVPGKLGVQTLSTQDWCFKKTVDYYYGLNDPAVSFQTLQQFGGGFTGYPFVVFDYNWLHHQLPVAGTLPQ